MGLNLSPKRGYSPFDNCALRAHLRGEGQVVRIAMSIRSTLVGGALALASLGLSAASAAAGPNPPCFFITQWESWEDASPNVIYLRVNLRDIYRADLSAGSQELTWPGSYHLISRVEGS